MTVIKNFLFRSPGQNFKALWERIPRLIKLTFFTAFALCMAVNLYKFTHFNIAHDSVWRFGTPAENLSSGRWLEMYAALVTGYNGLPWLNGVLICFYSSVTACLLVALLKMQKVYAAVLVAAIMITSPAATTIHAFLLVSDGAYLAVLLAVLGVYLAVRFKWGEFGGAAALAFSMGIYQANLALAAGLFVLVLILDCLRKEFKVKALLLRAVKFFRMLVIGFGAYFGILHLVFFLNPGTGLSNYKGMNKMGQLSLATLPEQIATSYREFFDWFAQHKYLPFWFPGSNAVLRLLLGAMGLACLVLLGVLAVRGKLWKNKGRLALLALLVAIFPLAVNSIYIMVPDVNAVSLMTRYPMAIVFLLYVAVTDMADAAVGSMKSAVLQGVCVLLCWFQLLAQGFICYNYTILANEAYLKEDVAQTQARFFTAQLLEDIRDFPGYTEGIPIRTIGRYQMPGQLADTSYFFEPSPITAYPNMDGLMAFYLYDKYIAIYFGKNIDYKKAENASWIAQNRREVDEMPLYPAKGSMLIEEGVLYIKLGEALPENYSQVEWS